MSAHIIELEAENVKKLKAVRIVPKGETVVISGKNGQGKSSTLDCIDFAFRGEKAICEEPLRHGEKRGRVFIKLSEELENVCTIERKFTPGGTTLEIRNRDGVPQKSPQALLEAIIAKVTFDPLSFLRKKREDQMEELRKLVGLDFTEINAARRAAYDERTIRNRELDAAKARLAACPFNASLPKEPVNITDLAKRLGDARSKNARNNELRASVTRQKNVAHDLSEDVKALRAKIETLKKMIADTEAQIDSKVKAHAEATSEAERMAAEIAALQNEDEHSLQKEIDSIQQTNAGIEANKRHLAAQDDVALLEGLIRGCTAKVQECDEMKAAQIEFAAFPMPGLSYDEERGVLLNGVPFSQGSQAEQLRAAVAIGLSLNPKVKVVLIRDGSLLDDDSMKLVSDMAAEHGAQIWIEVVNSKDPCAIVIEDGEVK